MTIGLFTPAPYKPTRYPFALEACRLQHRIHWIPETVPLGEDVRDWQVGLEPAEKNLLTQIFRLFTQMDIEVNDNYMDRYASVFKATEVKMMLSAFSAMETIHILAYALLLETVGMPDSEFSTFLEYKEMKDKHDYMQTFGMNSHADIARTLAMFGGFTEGLQLFAQFAMLMNFPRHGKMKGMGQIVSWSVRDESLHCDGMIKLYHAFTRESGVLQGKRGQVVKDDILDCCKVVVGQEDKFIELAFSQGPVKGMTPEDIKAYIRFIADWRLRQLDLPELYGGRRDNPLPWLQSMLSGVEHANFFEARATEYSQASSKGKWEGGDGVWGQFDKTAKDRHPIKDAKQRDPADLEWVNEQMRLAQDQQLTEDAPST